MTDPNQLLDASGALPQAQPPWPARDGLRITRVRAIVTAPEGLPLVVVRVDTSDDGLYGLGCATFTQRYAAVAAAVDEHVGPLAVGRHPADIEDITRLIHYSSYWRNGPVLNNALSGLDQALWDIAGKRAGMPVYELLGGRSRSAVEVYSHAAGAHHRRDPRPGRGAAVRGATATCGSRSAARAWARTARPARRGGYPRSPHPDGWAVEQYLRDAPRLFAAARDRLGDRRQPDARRPQPPHPEAGRGPGARPGALPALLPRRRHRPRALRPAARGARRLPGADRGGRTDRLGARRGPAGRATAASICCGCTPLRSAA